MSQCVPVAVTRIGRHCDRMDYTGLSQCLPCRQNLMASLKPWQSHTMILCHIGGTNVKGMQSTLCRRATLQLYQANCALRNWGSVIQVPPRLCEKRLTPGTLAAAGCTCSAPTLQITCIGQASQVKLHNVIPVHTERLSEQCLRAVL